MIEYAVTEDHPLFNLNKKQGRITLERLDELNKDFNKENVRCEEQDLLLDATIRDGLIYTITLRQVSFYLR